MKKKIISILCALVMTIASVEPVFAADEATLYNNFKNATRSTVNDLFKNNYRAFSAASTDFEYKDYMLILDAWDKEFNNFDELDANISAASLKLDAAEDDTTVKGLTPKSSTTINNALKNDLQNGVITETNPDNIFKIGDKEFILLDSEQKDGDTIFFVMAMDDYGTPAVDPETQGRWSYDKYNLLPYHLLYRLAFNIKYGTVITDKLPEEILKHLDVFHVWHTEPKKDATTETTLIAPISVISATELITYADKIGKGTASQEGFWTRTPVYDDITKHFYVEPSTLKFATEKSYNGKKLRPVFYLKSSFFKDVKLQECGVNVTKAMESVVTQSDVDALYSANDIKTVFKGLDFAPKAIADIAVVGRTLTAEYTYTKSITLEDVSITWEKSLDKENWTPIGATGSTYQLQESDRGYYIRAVYVPTFDSVVLKHGYGNYSVATETIACSEEDIMLEEFNSSNRGNIKDLLRQYSSLLGIDISGLSDYQLGVAGAVMAGIDYGTDLQRLRSKAAEAVAKARAAAVPDVSEENTENFTPGGFLQPNTEKPEPSGSEPSSLFSDLNSVPWAKQAITTLAEKGVLSGTGDGTFSPNNLITRNEFVKMIVSAFDIEMTDNELTYEDIDNSSWSAKYIAAAVNAGIISGVSETRFGNGMNITRQDTAVIADRLMKYKGMDLKPSSLNFYDADEISEYALESVAKMTYNRIMNGVDDKNFEPKNSTTRAMAAVIIYNLLSYYEKVTAPEEDTDDSGITVSRNDKYDVVFQLGILDESLSDNSKITRGQLAAALATIGRYGTSGNDSFEDVEKSHKYYKEIEAVYAHNIMAGRTDKLFKPDDVATYKEAFDALIALSGYANFPGGKQMAEKALWEEYVYAQDNDELTVNMAKKMFFAALEIRVLDINSIDSLRITEKTIMNLNFDAYKAKGIVNAVAGVAIAGRKEQDDDKLIITVDGKDYLYTGNGYDYSEYLGYEVTYFYQEIDDTYQILSIVLSNSAKPPLKLSFLQIENIDRKFSAVTYEENGKTRVAEISKGADFVYNGKWEYIVPQTYLNGGNVPDNGYITLVDTDKNGSYDVVKIEDYEYVMVAQINVSDRTILDKFTLSTYSFEEGKDADKINITKNGKFIKMDYISKGDVLAIARSADGNLMNVYVSDKKVTGNAVNKSPDDYELQIDNDVLKTVRSFNFGGISSDMTVTVGLDWNGYAVGYYAENTGSNLAYGYLYRIFKDEEANKLDFKLLTQDNEFVKLRQSDKVVLNGHRAEESGIKAIFNYNDTTHRITPQLIAYSLDADGNIRRIYTADPSAASGFPTTSTGAQTDPLVLNKKFTKSTADPRVNYVAFGMTLYYQCNMPGSAVMFDITLNGTEVDEENSRVTNISAKVIPKTERPEALYVYNSDISRVSRLCVYEHPIKGGNSGSDTGFSSSSFVVTKVIDEYDDYRSEVVRKFIGYRKGSEVVYTLSKKLISDLGTEISKIVPGDVLKVWMSGTEITKFRRLYSNDYANRFITDTKADVLCNYGTGVTYSSSNKAKRIYEQHEKNPDETYSDIPAYYIVSLYGDLGLVYKSDFYAYPVVQLKVLGNSDYESYTAGSSTTVYSYSKSANTIKVVDAESVNITPELLKKAVVTLYMGNIEDVVIYED